MWAARSARTNYNLCLSEPERLECLTHLFADWLYVVVQNIFLLYAYVLGQNIMSYTQGKTGSNMCHVETLTLLVW